MQKSVYVKEEDAQLWERAKELSNDKLSPVIVKALKQFVKDEEMKGRGFERIELRYKDSQKHGLPVAKAFHGRWIYPLAKPLSYANEDGTQGEEYAVAVTAQGRYAIHSWRWSTDNDGDQYRHSYKLSVFQSLEEAAKAPGLSYAAADIQERIGVPLEELDI